MHKLHYICLYTIIVCCLWVFWLLLSFEEVQTLIMMKRDYIRHSHFEDHRKDGISSAHLMKDSPRFVDRILVFTGHEQVISVQTGKTALHPDMESLRLEFPGFYKLNRGEGFLFTHIAGSGLWSPSVLYFDDKDWLDFPPRFFMHPNSRDIPDLATTPIRETPHYSPCIAYVKWYQPNPDLPAACRQFIINDHYKDTFAILLEGIAWTQFKITKILK